MKVSDKYKLDSLDELMEYMWLRPSRTLLNVDIFVDDGLSYVRHNHSLLLFTRNGYTKDDTEFIPFSVTTNPTILDDIPDLHIRKNDVLEIKRFITDNIENLKALAEENVGLGVGPGRGSAVGSLVCYLIGITGIDPMKYGLIFERFLNVERVSMPDIDSDFKTDIRDKVLDYVKHVYGEEAVCCIMTRGTQAAKASIRNAARLLGSEKFDDTAHFLSLGDAIAKKIPNEIGIKLTDCKEDLVKEFGGNAYAMEILNNALLIEGTFINVGMHAAGVIIADNGDVKQYVPLMWNKDKEQWMTQCEKDPCEANGLLKMDVRLVR